MFTKTQDDVPSCVNAVHIAERIFTELHHLLPFDDTSNVVNDQDHKAAPN